MVRSFYEARGDQVGFPPCPFGLTVALVFKNLQSYVY